MMYFISVLVFEEWLKALSKARLLLEFFLEKFVLLQNYDRHQVKSSANDIEANIIVTWLSNFEASS